MASRSTRCRAAWSASSRLGSAATTSQRHGQHCRYLRALRHLTLTDIQAPCCESQKLQSRTVLADVVNGAVRTRRTRTSARQFPVMPSEVRKAMQGQPRPTATTITVENGIHGQRQKSPARMTIPPARYGALTNGREGVSLIAFDHDATGASMI